MANSGSATLFFVASGVAIPLVSLCSALPFMGPARTHFLYDLFFFICVRVHGFCFQIFFILYILLAWYTLTTSRGVSSVFFFCSNFEFINLMQHNYYKTRQANLNTIVHKQSTKGENNKSTNQQTNRLIFYIYTL